MNSEPETTPQPDNTGLADPAEAEEPTTQATDEEPPPVEPPPVESEPDPEDDEPAPPPPPPPAPGSPVVFEPFLYYSVTSVCTTADKGDGSPCPNLNTTTTEPEIYSNAGQVRMICGLCGKDRPILAATKLDPQPEVS